MTSQIPVRETYSVTFNPFRFASSSIKQFINNLSRSHIVYPKHQTKSSTIIFPRHNIAYIKIRTKLSYNRTVHHPHKMAKHTYNHKSQIH
jgi:hypothetical protein